MITISEIILDNFDSTERAAFLTSILLHTNHPDSLPGYDMIKTFRFPKIQIYSLSQFIEFFFTISGEY